MPFKPTILETGKALQFDGSANYTSRAVVSTVVDNFSAMCWVNINALPGSAAMVFQNGASDANGYALFINSSGVFHGDITFVADVNSAFTLSTATWYHLAWIRTSGTSQLYVNGSAQGATSASAPNAINSFTVIGAQKSSAAVASGFFNGTVDDVRLYERAISTTELNVIYNRKTNPEQDIAQTNLKIWMKMDEDSLLATTADSSGSGLTFTHTGTPTVVTGIIPKRALSDQFGVHLRPRVFAPGVAR